MSKRQVKRQNAVLDSLWRGQAMLEHLGKSDAPYGPKAKRLAKAITKFINDEIAPIAPEDFKD